MKIIIKLIFVFVSSLINAILYPINALIESLFPNVSNALTSVTELFGWLREFTTWVISWLPFDTNFYQFVILSLIFIYSVPLLTNLIKLIVKWWHYLVP